MIKLEKILNFLEHSQITYNYIGDSELSVNKVSLPDNIEDNSIVWIKDPMLFEKISCDKVNTVLFVSSVGVNECIKGLNILTSENSKELFFSIVAHFLQKTQPSKTFGKSSTILTTHIGNGVSIGENCYIGADVSIGENVIIKNNVVLENKVVIGNNSVIFSGAVIGSDGYGYFISKAGLNVKVPHLGGVRIGDDVEIGANTCIDRGTIGDTVIGNNVKIDNLCHIAHNVVIENNVNVIALSMIAGSVILKENSYVAPSASIKNQLTIGKNSMVGLGAVVVKDVEENVVVAGVPAKVIRKLDGK
ncbi:MAG TPA: hypothetical protein DIC19_05760 [Erysipelotrichaceae bacterium]|nr:hypothetical protein [Erysipelotrichaceae bacterium]